MTRKRKKNKKKNFWLRRLLNIVGYLLRVPYVSVSLCALVVMVILYYGGVFHLIRQEGKYLFTVISKKTGLVVENVYLEGQKYTDPQDILRCMNIKLGTPILSLDLRSVQQDIQKLAWIRYAVVERLLPSTLSVRIIERTPLALWQYQSRVKLIDTEGVVIEHSDLTKFTGLIILVGEDVPVYAKGFLAMLQSSPDVMALISSAVRINKRRWDVYLHNGTYIKLPENNVEAAWRYLLKKQQEKNLLDGQFKSIDLRIEDKMFLQQMTSS